MLGALTIERGVDAVSYLALLVGATWTLGLPEPVARWRTAASAALAVAIGALLLTAVPRRRPDASLPPSLPVPGRAGAITRYRRRLVPGMGDVSAPGPLSAAMALSMAAWGAAAATYHLTARAAHLGLPLAGSVAALLMVGASFLVRATPGQRRSSR